MQVTVTVRYSFVDKTVKKNIIPSTLTSELKKGKSSFIFMNIAIWLNCDQEKQRRWWTVEIKSPEISLQGCC